MAWSVLVARVRSLWRGLGRRADIEADMSEEFRQHLELRTADLVRRGLPVAEAARRARIEFGSTESHKEAARAARGLWFFDQIRFSWLDVKLGLRMLVRYPGLTIVAGLTMAFALGVGAGVFEVIKQLLNPTLPLPEGDRIVVVTYHDRVENEEQGACVYDLLLWREGLRSVQDVGGYRSVDRNLGVGNSAGEPVQAAEISAAAFRVTRTPALLGRPLIESDEAPGAPHVIVLGYRLWQTRFQGDATVLGRTVRIGDVAATVVGVMAEGYRFPIAHQAWVPLRLQELPRQPAQGPSVRVFGRLASGATLEEARAEATTLAARAAANLPQHYEHLMPQVTQYAVSFQEVSADDTLLRASVYSINLLAIVFVILVCGNVALLMFARAATREREMLVRNALGTGRIRIVTQLFVEALVLGALAAGLGLAATGPALRAGLGAIFGGPDRSPFWIHASLSPSTVIYAVALTVIGAAIAGVIPALKVMGGSLETRLRMTSAGGGGLRMGGIWTMALTIVADPGQVAGQLASGDGVAFLRKRR